MLNRCGSSALMILALIAAVACGSAPASVPTTPPPETAASSAPASVSTAAAAQTTAPTPAPTPTPTPGIPLSVSACELMSWADLGDLVSPPAPEPVLQKFDPQSNDSIKGTGCSLRPVQPVGGATPPLLGELSLKLLCCFDDAKFDTAVRQFAGADQPRPTRDITSVGGVGDRAYFTGFECIVGEGTRPFEIWFLKRPYSMQLTISRIGAWENNNTCKIGASRLPGPVFISVAQKILGRMATAKLTTPTPLPTLVVANVLRVTAPPVVGQGQCATAPVLTVPEGFNYAGCNEYLATFTYTWRSSANGVLAFSVYTGLGQLSNPGGTAVDINGNPGTITIYGPQTFQVNWTTSAKVSLSASSAGVPQETLLAFVRSMRQ